MISIRAGSRRSHDRGGSGDIECQRHESSGVSREGGGSIRGVISPLIGWIGGLPHEIFLKLGCLRMDFKTIFKPVSVILQAIFFFYHFQEVGGSIPAAWGRQHSFVCHSLPSSDSRRAVVSFWQKNVHCTG